MKKYLFALVALLALTTQGHAQKFLDIYHNGNVVSSVKAADVDSLAVGHGKGKRTLYFWQQGKIFHTTTIFNADSVKVFRTEDEPLVFLGIVGFNQELYEKPFSYLDQNTAANFKSFVGNLQRKDGTLLYYGVDHALDMLQSTSFPAQVSSVNLITFTDGLDQGSLMMGSYYNTDEQYLNAVSSRIGNMTVKGLPLTAYSLGLRGSDVSNYSLFQRNLNKLASSTDKAFEVTSMSAVRTRLQEISDQIISISNKQTISMKIPGQSDGTVIRFTFDNASAANSTLYIEGTFQLSDRSLRNVTYHGLKAESGSVVQGRQNGIFVTYTFNGLQRADGYGLVPTNNICQYYRSANAPTWQVNSEFTPANNTQTIITHSGSVILLALDCSSSLGSQFSDMQSYAEDFIDRVANNAAIHIERPFEIDNSGTINGRNYVDLGLPSGTLWATCNIGANSPEEYGDYFAWGETEGYNGGKTTFNWSTYKWCNGSYNTMTKYCTDSSYGNNGFTDNKTELDPQDDAAYVNWGPAWRMPSEAQFAELFNSNYTTTTWTTQNGVYGRLITSKKEGYTGNCVFLPAAGCRSNSSLNFAGSYGVYWSRTLNESYPIYAWYLYFDSSDVYTLNGSCRYDGLSVRPVRVSE
jgi:hypothetical protein